MARCNFDKLLDTIGENKLTKEEEVTFTIHAELPDCRKLDAKSLVEASGDYTYNRYARPVNRFECMRTGCTTTGTLNMASANETVLYHAMYDATEFAAGVITYYVRPSAGVTFPIKVTTKVSDEKNMANADVYETTITAKDVTDDGFVPVLVDLSTTPTSVEGEGWTATSSGVFIQLSADKIVGYSSISIYESIFDFETNDTIKVTCLSEVGGTFDVDALEATCLEAGYDDSVSGFDYTVNGNKVSPNYWRLNPLMERGDRTEGFLPVTTEKEVLSYNDGTHGYVRLADAAVGECGYFAVEISDDCDVTEAYLAQLSIPVLANVDEGHYQILRNEDGTTDIIVNKSLIGKSIKIAYPQAATIESELVADTDNLNHIRVRMVVPRTTSDGAKYLLVFDNVLITSFPATINEEETQFSFSINIQRNPDGSFFRRQRIAKAN